MFDINNILEAFAIAIAPPQLLALAIGSVVGALIGALPGASATMGIAIMIPLTYWFAPQFALILLMAVYTSGIFGGSISAILLNIPGTAASAATCFDGHPLAKAGKGGKAIMVALVSSVIGGIVSAVALLFCAPALASIALSFGPLETAAVALFGLTVVASVSSENMPKGLLMGALGMVLGTVGLDGNTGFSRFSFGFTNLYSGIPVTAFLIGCFSVPEAISICMSSSWGKVVWDKSQKIAITWREFRTILKTVGISTAIGMVVGLIPAIGPETATFVAYDRAKKISKEPETFGTGNICGIAASESANNAVVGTSLAPMFALGIPGSGAAMVLMGGLMVHGMQPGPNLFNTHQVMLMTLFLGLILAQLFMLPVGYTLAKFAPHILRIKPEVMGPAILIICMVSTFALNNNIFGVYVMLIGGIFAYIMRKAGFSLIPLLLGLMLGPMFETYLVRAVAIASAKGSFLDYFLTRPITMVILAVTFLTVAAPVIWRKLVKRESQREITAVEE